MKVTFIKIGMNNLSIDHSSLENLEILYDKRKGDSNSSLFGVINKTKVLNKLYIDKCRK